VVVLEESLGSEFVGSLDPGGSGLTPEFDRLAREGTLLSHAYSTGNRTIRALEATTASLPPLPGISIVRREASRDLFTLPALLRQRGYRTLFVYGGRALFDGMGAYLRANGVERIVDEDDFSKDAFHTAWGVCDEAIFDRALREMDRLDGAGEAVYMLTLTVSNHRPFLYPTGRIPLDPSARRRRHAVRYADWALGRFVAAARRRPWFSRTLFVLMGDHGARVYGAAAIPMASYQVPILFFAPKLVPARRVDTLASSLDVPPTVLGILGLEYDSKFFGRDVLALPPSRGRALMTHNREVALLEGPTLAVLGLKSSALVYRYDSASGELRPVERPSPAENAVVQDAVAYYCEADRIYRSGRYRFEGKPPRAKLTRVGEGRWHGARPGG
jgi:phosphoglycerol transferase MdoB-like AlkP superfamily enzyme